MTYYLLFILYSLETMEMMLDNKQIWGIFLFEFKMCHKAVETTCNINNAFGPGTANESMVQWRFKKFWEGKKALEDKYSAGHWKLTTTTWEDHRSWSFTAKWEVPEALTIDHSMSVQHLKQIVKVRKLDKCVPHELTKNKIKKKVLVLKYCLLLCYSTTMNHF